MNNIFGEPMTMTGTNPQTMPRPLLPGYRPGVPPRMPMMNGGSAMPTSPMMAPGRGTLPTPQMGYRRPGNQLMGRAPGMPGGGIMPSSPWNGPKPGVPPVGDPRLPVIRDKMMAAMPIGNGAMRPPSQMPFTQWMQRQTGGR